MSDLQQKAMSIEGRTQAMNNMNGNTKYLVTGAAGFLGGTICRQLIERACEKYNLSMRAVSRIMKVSRTIADLAGDNAIGKKHVLEALGYRCLEGDYWK